MELPIRPATDLRDYCHLANNLSDRGQIFVFPAGRLDRDYLSMLARLDLEPVAHGDMHPLLNMMEHIRQELSPDWLLLDCRAGLSEASGFALSGLANLTVLFGTTSAQSWEGLRLVVERLGGRRVDAGKPQAECLIVQAMTPENSETGRLAGFGFSGTGRETYSGKPIMRRIRRTRTTTSFGTFAISRVRTPHTNPLSSSIPRTLPSLAQLQTSWILSLKVANTEYWPVVLRAVSGERQNDA